MDTQLEHRNLIELFDTSVGHIADPARLCLEIVRQDRHETLTFGQLRERARTFASWLVTAANVQVGDKIAIVSKNRTDWDVALWGAILAGAIPVLIDPERGPDGVIDHVKHTDTRLLVMADEYRDAESQERLRRFCRRNDVGLVEMTNQPLPGNASGGTEGLAAIGSQVGLDDTAIILCTSGTTGDPREVELTHRNFLANLKGSIEKIHLTERDVLCHILPPHHSFGLTVGKFLPLWAGAPNIYTNKYREVSRLIGDRKATIFIAIPALYTAMAKRIEESLAKGKENSLILGLLDRYFPKLVGKMVVRKQGWQALRFCLSGAAPMPRWVLNVFWRRGLRLYEGYGTTENSPVYGFNEDVRTVGSVGRPISTLTVKIVDDQGNQLAPGQRGEIALGGPCIMKGYYKNPEATDRAVWTDADGVRWLRTGDLGYLDAQGNLSITGRKKYLIVLPGGKNVNPETVETALSQAPFVHEILVVPGYERDSHGVVEETIKAIVTPAWDQIEAHTREPQDRLSAEPAALKDLIWQSVKQCQQQSKHLSSFERIAPKNLEIRIEEFQKTSTGKIRREAYVPQRPS